jgi:ABC-type Mn2+/Zn2+ transport system ATPase subunit
MSERLTDIRDANFGYGRTSVLQGVQFSLAAGDFVGLVGPNGAGKTTLLRGLLGLIRPQRGERRINPPDGAADVVFGYVPQEKAVDPFFPLSVLDVVLMGRYRLLGPGRRPTLVDQRAALACLGHVRLEHLADASFQDLSGGQKQRVLLARALATEPHVLVLDEPTSAMDLAAQKRLMAVISEQHEIRGLTVILATHDLNLIGRYASTIAIVADGQVISGSPAELLETRQLSEVYGVELQVHEVQGRRFIV